VVLVLHANMLSSPGCGSEKKSVASCSVRLRKVSGGPPDNATLSEDNLSPSRIVPMAQSSPHSREWFEGHFRRSMSGAVPLGQSFSWKQDHTLRVGLCVDDNLRA